MSYCLPVDWEPLKVRDRDLIVSVSYQILPSPGPRAPLPRAPPGTE